MSISPIYNYSWIEHFDSKSSSDEDNAMRHTLQGELHPQNNISIRRGLVIPFNHQELELSRAY